MLKLILLGLALLLAGILLYAGTKPDVFRVERSLLIQAPAERLLPYLEDFHRWSAWSPYEKLDPAMQRRYSGAERGPGASYAWESQGKAGVGRMTILASQPEELKIDLEFIKPFPARNLALFTLRPEAGGIRLSWSMQGPNPYIAKVMQVFFNMDRMVGADFEAGLASLKALAESET